MVVDTSAWPSNSCDVQDVQMPREHGCTGAATVRISLPDSSKCVAKECRNVWQLTFFDKPSVSEDFFTDFCRILSCIWCRMTLPDRGSADNFEEGNTYIDEHGCSNAASAWMRKSGPTQLLCCIGIFFSQRIRQINLTKTSL